MRERWLQKEGERMFLSREKHDETQLIGSPFFNLYLALARSLDSASDHLLDWKFLLIRSGRPKRNHIKLSAHCSLLVIQSTLFPFHLAGLISLLLPSHEDQDKVDVDFDFDVDVEVEEE